MSHERCRSCGAAVRVSAPWCSLCYADLRRQSQPAPVATGHGRIPRDIDPLTAPYDLVAAAADGRNLETSCWPCGQCAAANAMEEQVCASCGAGFLSALQAGTEPLLALPGVGRVTRLSRRARFGIALGLAVLVTVAVAALFLIADALL